MQNSISKIRREAIQHGKAATNSFREAMLRINPGLGLINQISQQEFVARRNKFLSEHYSFKEIGPGSNPIQKKRV